MTIKKALLSVHDKTGIVAFAQGLSQQGVELIFSIPHHHMTAPCDDFELERRIVLLENIRLRWKSTKFIF